MSKQFVFTDDNGQQYPEWEQKKLGEVISEGKAGGTPTASNKAFYNGAHAVIPFLGISDMTSQGKHLSSTSKCITQEALDSSSAWLVPAGHLVYAMYASVGKVGITQTPMAMSQALFAMDFNEGAFTEYVYSYLEQFRENGLDALITTGTQGNINASTLRSIVIPLPSLPEQKKIAGFFSVLDERIELTENKLALLKEQKRGFLQQVFNRELVFTDDNGEQYPEWEEKKLGEIFSALRGKSLSKADLDPTGAYSCVLYGQLYSTYGNVISKAKSKTDNASGIQSVYGDVLIPASGESAKDIARASALLQEQVQLGGDLNILRPKNLQSTNPVFLALSLSHSAVNKQIAGKAQGNSVVHLSWGNIKDLDFLLPSLPEQVQIAEFFSVLDERIELTENKLALLKEQKKGYLQGIFG